MDTFFRALWIMAFLHVTHYSLGQGMKMGEILILNHPEVRTSASAGEFKNFLLTDWLQRMKSRQSGADLHLFQADRGNRKGELLMVCSIAKQRDRAKLPAGSPFTDNAISTRNSLKLSGYISNADVYTEYHLLGPAQFRTLPSVSILGIHFLKVREEVGPEFEKFVQEKMHPRVGNLFPDMHLLTYKGTDGDQQGSYITVFAIRSTEARDQYWPAGKPETATLKNAFSPLGDLAAELKEFLVPDSYLEPGGGAAAIFESKEWTDYILQTPVLNKK